MCESCRRASGVRTLSAERGTNPFRKNERARHVAIYSLQLTHDVEDAVLNRMRTLILKIKLYVTDHVSRHIPAGKPHQTKDRIKHRVLLLIIAHFCTTFQLHRYATERGW